MIVQVFASNEEQAGFILDQDGGFVSEREVSLIKTTSVFEPKNDRE